MTSFPTPGIVKPFLASLCAREARASRYAADTFFGTSTFSARAATIFDLVIGFAIESILLSPCCVGFFGKAGHSTWPPRPAVNMISHSIDGPRALWGNNLPVVRCGFFADHEDGLARTDETELLAREPLDRRRVRAQRPDLGREAGVVRLELLDLPSEGLGPLPLAHELQQPAVAEQRSDEETHDDDDRGEDRRLLPKADFRPPALVPDHF